MLRYCFSSDRSFFLRYYHVFNVRIGLDIFCLIFGNIFKFCSTTRFDINYFHKRKYSRRSKNIFKFTNTMDINIICIIGSYCDKNNSTWILERFNNIRKIYNFISILAVFRNICFNLSWINITDTSNVGF